MTPERQSRRPKRFLNWWSDYRWFLWAAAVGLTFILGLIGFHQHFVGRGHHSFADLVYLSLQLFPLQSGAVHEPVPWELQVARIAAPALAAVGIIGAVTAVIRAFQQEQWKLSRLKDHAVVCGCGRRGSFLAVALAGSDDQEGSVVVIENGDHPEYIESCRQAGVLVLSGDATDPAVLERARIDRATRLVALCGEDAVNARIAVAARAALQRSPNPQLQAHVHVADEELRELLENEPSQSRGEDPPLSSLKVFDLFEVGAKQMLDMEPRFQPSDWDANDRLLVAGLGELGKHLVVEATCRFKTAGRPFPLQTTILDHDAKGKITHLQVANEELAAHWSLNGWEEDLAGPEFDRGDYLSDSEVRSVRAIYVCFDDEPLALTTTLRLKKRFRSIPINVRMTHEKEGLATVLPEPGNVFPFGLTEAACRPEYLLSLGEDPASH